MAQGQTKKEALFNEVKGSLFEYLVAREIAIRGKEELNFQKSLDRNYLMVLSQQDRLVRQFYPEMLPFLNQASKLAAETLIHHLKEIPVNPKVVGKFSNSVALSTELHEADIILTLKGSPLPLSLKLNKKHAFVNTKSGGIKSFFNQYFPFIDSKIQDNFNQFVDREFSRMAFELHALYDLEFPGHFNDWVAKGYSELPGELDAEARAILKSYYSRIAYEMHSIFKNLQESNVEEFKNCLPTLMGFSSKEILQLIYFHDFPENTDPLVEIHSFEDVNEGLSQAKMLPFHGTSSVEFEVGDWALQVRVKPMNKFTTTAIKINCSVKVKRSNAS